ncbi:MAG: Hsp20/alpha crystallin family protein [Chloroflexota bacterium]
MAVTRKTESRAVKVGHPIRDLEEIERRFDNMFHGYDWRFFPSIWPTSMRETLFVPAIDMIEKPDRYLLRVELPSMKREDIELSIAEDMLTISGEKTVDTKDEKDNYLYREHSYGSFRRLVELPSDVNTGKIEATYAKGTLEVTLLKSKETKSKKIPVHIKENSK